MKRSVRIKADIVITVGSDDDGEIDTPKVCESLTELDAKTRAIAELLVPNGVLETDPAPKVTVGLTRKSSFEVKREVYRRANEANKTQAPVDTTP